LCVGHPDPDELEFHKSIGHDISVHGCCGCCVDPEKARARRLIDNALKGDDLDREALTSNYQGMDDLDREALGIKDEK
jgi:hypothetical protein